MLDLERGMVMKAWKERWSDRVFMECLLTSTLDPKALTNSLLDLLGAGPNAQLLHFLELAISCEALPLCTVIHSLDRVNTMSITVVNSIMKVLSKNIDMIRLESDPVDASKLPSALLALVEWLVLVQVEAVKQLTNNTETDCLSLMKGCSAVVKCVAADPLLSALLPLWGDARFYSLPSAIQNIQIPYDACSDDGKRALASCLTSFTLHLETLQASGPVNENIKPPLRHSLNYPCKLLLFHDVLYRSHYSSSSTVEYLQKASRHYGCSIEKILLEWSCAHLRAILDTESMHQWLLILSLMLYKLPRVIAEVLQGKPKLIQSVIITLSEQELLWCSVTTKTKGVNMYNPLLQVFSNQNLISKDVFEVLCRKGLSMPASSTVVNIILKMELVLKDFLQIVNQPVYNPSCLPPLINLLSSITATPTGSSFVQQCEIIVFVAVAKGQLTQFVAGLNNIIEGTCDGGDAGNTEEGQRIAIFDMFCLLICRVCMMFGVEALPPNAAFSRWLGSHVCSPQNPFQTLIPLLHPQRPSNHQENINVLVSYFATAGPLNTKSLQHVLIALPAALKEVMVGLRSKAIPEDKFSSQTMAIKQYLLSVVFIAIHWLVHYNSSLEDDWKNKTRFVLKEFLRNVSFQSEALSRASTGILVHQRVNVLHDSLNESIEILGSTTVVKHLFWVKKEKNAPPESKTSDLSQVWKNFRTNPTLEDMGRLLSSNNICGIVEQAVLEPLRLPLPSDYTHAIFVSAVFLQTDPRFVPWLLEKTLPPLLTGDIPVNLRSNVWALSQLSVLAIDLYLISVQSTPPDLSHHPKRVCRAPNLLPSNRSLHSALPVFWKQMRCISEQEECNYSTAFLHRFISYFIELNRVRLAEIITYASPGTIKSISEHLIQSSLVAEGLTLYQLSGQDQSQCAALLQSIL